MNFWKFGLKNSLGFFIAIAIDLNLIDLKVNGILTIYLLLHFRFLAALN